MILGTQKNKGKAFIEYDTIAGAKNVRIELNNFQGSEGRRFMTSRGQSENHFRPGLYDIIPDQNRGKSTILDQV